MTSPSRCSSIVRRASPKRALRSTRSRPTRAPAWQCRHNLNYWRFGDYLGIGAGAHGKAMVDGAVIRTEKPRSPRAYLAAGGPAGYGPATRARL